MSITVLAVWCATVIVVAYFVGRSFDGVLQTMAVWVGAGLLITIGIIVFVNSQGTKAQKGWLDKYKVEGANVP